MSWGGFWQMYGVLVLLAVAALVAWLHARHARGNEAQRLLDRFRLPFDRPKRDEATEAPRIVNLADEVARLTSRSPTEPSRWGRVASWLRGAPRHR
jgi:hypothetical protein